MGISFAFIGKNVRARRNCWHAFRFFQGTGDTDITGMDDILDLISNLFNFGLAVILAALLWHLVHPEHFNWLHRLMPKSDKTVAPLPRWLRVTGLVTFCLIMAGAAAFGLYTVLHERTY